MFLISSKTNVVCAKSFDTSIDVALSRVTSYFNVFLSTSKTGLNNSIGTKSCCHSISSTTKTELGTSTVKLSVLVNQLPIKPQVAMDFTILSDLYENNTVLSDKSSNSKEYTVSLISEIEPDCAYCIAKNSGSSVSAIISCA